MIVKIWSQKRSDRRRTTGLRKLIEKNNLDIENLSAYHIGFVIGPCLNAGVSVKERAKVALRMLLAEDPERAGEMADELKELNDMRKDMTAKGEAEAIEQVEKQYMDDKVLVVFLPECHESLAGIIAGRLREHFHKPSFVLTRGETTAKGSGRPSSSITCTRDSAKSQGSPREVRRTSDGSRTFPWKKRISMSSGGG